MRIGACQTPEILGDVDAALRVMRDFALQADAASVDLLLFPECFLQGYLVTEEHLNTYALKLDSPRFDAVLTQLAQLRQMLVFGMIEQADGHYYNTAVVIAGGKVIGRYRKTFLVRGESLFSAGDSYPVFDCAGVHFGINICYDTQHPQAAAAVAAAGAQALLVPAQNMMSREKAFWWQDRHNEIRACRAQETGMWLASADVTGERGSTHLGLGPTGILNPAGESMGQVPTGVPGMATADINPVTQSNLDDP
nr:carbon-nitrogen hydrolase family protein [uncultured Actinoplanes sp.]